MKRNYRIYLNILILVTVVSGLLLLPTNVKAALGITAVAPNTIANNHENTITVSGSDFVNGSVVSLDGYGALSTSFITNIALMATVPAGIPVGTYTITVTNPDTTTASLNNALTVTHESPTATVTSTVEPPTDDDRPVIVVDTYSINQDIISPGSSFILFVTLYNAGQKYATNIVVTFSPGDLIPRETGGVVAVDEIAPGNHREFSQPFTLGSDVWDSVATTTMEVSYTNETGMTFSKSFAITLPVFHYFSAAATSTPTPTQTPIPSLRPQLVIKGYSTDVTPLQPGAQFQLSLTVQNMGSATAKRVTMIVGGGSGTSGSDGTQQPGGISGASGEFTNFAPIGASNVQSLGDFPPGYLSPATQSLIVNVNTTPGAYPLKVSFVYIDEKNHTFVDDQVITLLVHRLPMLEINFYQQVSTLFTGQPNTLPIQVVNLGRNSIVLGNMRVNGTSGQFSNNSTLVGNLDPGGYFTLDATYIPDVPGAVDLVVSIDYTNDFNQSQVITKTLSVDVMEQPIIEPPVDGGQNGGMDVNPPTPETFLQKIWRFILGLFGLDSGLNNQQQTENPPIETSVPDKGPIIVPVSPPLKGP